MPKIVPDDVITVVGPEMYSRMVNDAADDADIAAFDHDADDVTSQDMPDISRSIARICSRNMRTKPSYTDCWILGTAEEMEAVETYSTGKGIVTIGNASDGQVEYNLVPYEYTLDDTTQNVISETIGRIREHFTESDEAPSKRNIMSKARSILTGYAERILRDDDPKTAGDVMGSLSETVYRYTMGMGIFDTLLSDPRLEDIYLDAPCDRNRIHVTLTGINGFNSHIRCRTNLLVDRREVQNLISTLRRESGLPFCESSPVLETDLREHDARATVIGHPLSPEGDAVAIRKHSARLWTLTRLVGNGTLDDMTAGLLSFLVDNRSTFLINGARGSGKSSLLSALMFEFPLSQRILTIEDTMELPCDRMRAMGYKIQSMLIDDRTGDAVTRSEEALRVSLRMGESAIVIGEVRGEEAKTLYQSMRAGKAGSSIMGTIHGDSAMSVYQRVVHDLGIQPEAFMATDTIITMGTRRLRGSSRHVRKLTEIVSTTETHGTFVDMFDGDVLSEDALNAPLLRRIMQSSSMTQDDIITEVSVRAGMRRFLADMASGDDRFYGPEWISMANDFLSKQLSAGVTDGNVIMNGFKEWFGRYNGLVL